MHYGDGNCESVVYIVWLLSGCIPGDPPKDENPKRQEQPVKTQRQPQQLCVELLMVCALSMVVHFLTLHMIHSNTKKKKNQQNKTIILTTLSLAEILKATWRIILELAVFFDQYEEVWDSGTLDRITQTSSNFWFGVVFNHVCLLSVEDIFDYQKSKREDQKSSVQKSTSFVQKLRKFVKKDHVMITVIVSWCVPLLCESLSLTTSNHDHNHVSRNPVFFSSGLLPVVAAGTILLLITVWFRKTDTKKPLKQTSKKKSFGTIILCFIFIIFHMFPVWVNMSRIHVGASLGRTVHVCPYIGGILHGVVVICMFIKRCRARLSKLLTRL